MNSFSVSLLSTLTTRISRTGNDRRIQRRRSHGQGHVVFETSNRGSRLRETEFGSGERRSSVWIVSPTNRPSIEPCESRRACVIYRLHTTTLRRINDSGSSPTFTHATEAASCYVEFLRKPLRHLFVEINREMKREREAIKPDVTYRNVWKGRKGSSVIGVVRYEWRALVPLRELVTIIRIAG